MVVRAIRVVRLFFSAPVLCITCIVYSLLLLFRGMVRGVVVLIHVLLPNSPFKFEFEVEFEVKVELKS